MASDVTVPDLGRRLCSARLQRGFSQGTLARRCGVAPSYLSRIENGKIQPTFRTVMRICQALQGDLEEILGLDAARPRRGACPVSARGRCMLDLIRAESNSGRGTAGAEAYTPRQIRLLRRLAEWLRFARPDRLRAMEILLEDLMQGQPADPAARTAS